MDEIKKLFEIILEPIYNIDIKINQIGNNSFDANINILSLKQISGDEKIDIDKIIDSATKSNTPNPYLTFKK